MTRLALPDYYYCATQPRSSGVSPSAILDPCSDSSATAWQTSTTPGTRKVPKKLILSHESTIEHSHNEMIAMVRYLKSEGFSFLTKSVDDVSNETEPFIDRADIMLGPFEPDSDYALIAKKLNIPRSSVIWLDKMAVRDIFAHLQAPKTEIEKNVFGNEFKVWAREVDEYNDDHKIITDYLSNSVPKITEWNEKNIKSLIKMAMIGDEIVINEVLDLFCDAQLKINDILVVLKNLCKEFILGETPDSNERPSNISINKKNSPNIGPLLENLFREDNFFKALNGSEIQFVQLHIPEMVTAFLARHTDYVDALSTSDRVQLALDNAECAAVLWRFIESSPDLTPYNLKQLAALYHFIFSDILAKENLLSKIINSEPENPNQVRLKEALQFFRAYSAAFPLKIDDKLALFRKNAFVFRHFYHYHLAEIIGLLTNENYKIKIFSILSKQSSILKVLFTNTESMPQEQVRQMMQMLFSCSDEFKCSDTDFLIDLLSRDNLAQYLDTKTLPHFLFKRFKTFQGSFINSDDFHLTHRFAHFFEDYHFDSDQEYINCQNLILSNKFELCNLIEFPAIYYAKLLDSPQMRQHLKPQLLLSLAKLDFHLAYIILTDNELKSRLTKPEIAFIVLRYPELLKHVKNYLQENHSKTTIKALSPVLFDCYFTEKFMPSLLALETKVDCSRIYMARVFTLSESFFDHLNPKDLICFFNSICRNNIEFLIFVSSDALMNFVNIHLPELAYRTKIDKPELIPSLQGPQQPIRIMRDMGTKKLFIGNHDQCSKVYNSNAGLAHQKYTMVESGEVLSGDLKNTPSVRTRIESFQYDPCNHLLNLTDVLPTRIVSKIDIHFISHDTVGQYRTLQDEFAYFLFAITIPAGDYTRLLSIHPEEILIGIVGEPVSIRIEKCDDGFYYAYTQGKRTIKLDYIVRVHRKYLDAEMSYAEIPASDPMKEYIDTYRNEQYGFRWIADPNQPVPDLSQIKNFDAWCERLYEERAGVCWHRALAVYTKLCRTGFENRARMVEIDNNHSMIEIEYQGSWIMVDMGGGANFTLSYTTDITDTADTADTAETLPQTPPPTTQRQQVVTQKIDRLHSLLVKQANPQRYDSVDTLFSFVDSRRPRKIILCSLNVNNTANALLKKCADNHRQLFYIHSASQLSTRSTVVTIDASKQPTFKNITPLENYLMLAEQLPHERFILMIDIRQSTLSAQTLLSLNTCFDTKRTICGLNIPDNVCVVSITDKLSDDASFLSRQDEIIHLSIPQEQAASHSHDANKLTLDLEGVENWKKALLGRIALQGNSMSWHPGKLVPICALNTNTTVCLTHFPETKRDEINYFLAQSKASGYFEYCGYHIEIPATLYFECGDNHYDFSSYALHLPVHENANVSVLPDDIYLINTYTFDFLLQDKRILNGEYFEEPGLLERHANQVLALFITTELTDAQWWCLFKNASSHDVGLSLYLAPGVSLPTQVQYEEAVLPATTDLQKNIVITNYPDHAVNRLLMENPTALVFDVEDYSFQTLAYEIFYEKTNAGFAHFEIRYTDLFKALSAGWSVILKGEFTHDLLAYLETLLLPKNPYLFINGEKTRINGRLHCVIEDNTLDDQLISRYQEIFRWTVAQNESVPCVHFTISPTTQPILTIESKPDLSSTLEKAEADAFIQCRIDTLFSALTHHNMVQCIGHSGVGKSRLMLSLQTDQTAQCTIYRELDQLQNWADDHSSKMKILFIDESNIDDRHYTLFSTLKTDRDHCILWNGRIIRLDKNHKVVFARNPHHYGGGRVEQKLFSDFAIPEIHYSDFSPAYIYHALLKPIYDAAHLDISEDNFKVDCLAFIEAYLARNQQEDEKLHMTVRELQHHILMYCFEHKKRLQPFFGSARCRLFQSSRHDHYILTPSSALVRAQLTTFLQIKKLQQRNQLPANIGLNGILIEGEPGVGKSAVAVYLLHKMGMPHYVKIDASIPLEQKKILLMKAFHAGNPVLLDEINSCTDDGFEKFMNKLLTGEDPCTGVAPNRPGFFLIATANGIELDGRSQISPALRHRCLSVTMQKPTRDDVISILSSKYNRLDVDIDTLATDFIALQEKTSSVTLRGLLSNISAASALYPGEECLMQFTGSETPRYWGVSA